MEEVEAGVETVEGGERGCEEGLVDVAGAGDEVDAVVGGVLRRRRRVRGWGGGGLRFPFPCVVRISNITLFFLLLLLFLILILLLPSLLLFHPFLLSLGSSNPPLKLLRSPRTELIPAPHHVGPVCVVGRVQRCEQGEHFCGVAAAAEDDEEVRGGAAGAGGWTGAVGGGEDVEESELGGGEGG